MKVRHALRARAALLAGLTLSLVVGSVFAAPPFRLTPPAGMDGPETVRSLMGATHAWRARSAQPPLELLITTLAASEIAARIGAMSDVQCINLFLDELRSHYAGFFVASQKRPLAVGNAEFTQFRWTGERGGETLTGVLSCGRLEGRWYVIHFSGALASAARSFPAIRASLRTLTPLAR